MHLSYIVNLVHHNLLGFVTVDGETPCAWWVSRDLCSWLCPSKAIWYVLLLSPGGVHWPGTTFYDKSLFLEPIHGSGTVLGFWHLRGNSVSLRAHRKIRLPVISVLVGEFFPPPRHSFIKRKVFRWFRFYVFWFQPSAFCRPRVLPLSSKWSKC